jgi:RND superfamily putative drug exporter
VYHHFAAIDAITAALAREAHVAEVQGPTRPTGHAPSVSPQTLQTEIAMLPDAVKQAIRAGQAPQIGAAPGGGAGGAPNPQLLAAIGAYAASVQYISADTTTVQLSVIFTDDPYALPAINRIPGLRAAASRALAASGLGADAATSATVYLAGQTAQLTDTQADDLRDTRLIVPVTLALVGIVLLLLLRSLIAPLYLLAAVTLNFFAAIGVCSFVFQRVQGQDGIYYAIPLYTFIFLVALGADYTIFLMSRVREEGRHRGMEAGVPVAVANTGGVITSAGLILAGTFAVLTTTPLTLLYQFGVCVAVGVLLDTFIVRGLLIPSLALLLGRWNWWPGALDAPDGGDTTTKGRQPASVPH